MRLHITKNFHINEFKCPCCGVANISEEFVEHLQRLRDIYGEPIYITSGYRCPEYNRQIGGYYKSPHLTGKAVDIVTELKPVTMAYMADDLEVFRIGIYRGHIHLDILEPRPSKYWLVKSGNVTYSRNIKELNEFLRGVN